MHCVFYLYFPDLSFYDKTRSKVHVIFYNRQILASSFIIFFVVVMLCSVYFNEVHQGDSGVVGNWSRGTLINIEGKTKKSPQQQ